MKKRDYILHYSISLVLCFAFVSVTYNHKTPCEHKSILTEIQGLKSTILGEIDTIEINKALLDKIDELTRENTVLRQEVACQASQLQEYENIVKGD
jgi:hypothetical protein